MSLGDLVATYVASLAIGMVLVMIVWFVYTSCVVIHEHGGLPYPAWKMPAPQWNTIWPLWLIFSFVIKDLFNMYILPGVIHKRKGS